MIRQHMTYSFLKTQWALQSETKQNTYRNQIYHGPFHVQVTCIKKIHETESCTSELQLKVNCRLNVNCRIKFGLVWPPVSRPAQKISHNLLSTAIHLYMIRPLNQFFMIVYFIYLFKKSKRLNCKNINISFSVTIQFYNFQTQIDMYMI